jgi:hypothetical protein
METIVKILHTAEIKRRSVCVPKDKQHLLPGIGEKLILKDELTGSMHNTIVGSQYRIRMPSWYEEHGGVKAGDTITIQQKNGIMSVNIEPKGMVRSTHLFERRGGKLSILEGRVLDLIIEAFAEIENGGIPATVRVDHNGIQVEWGDHIKSTEITLGNTKVGLS